MSRHGFVKRPERAWKPRDFLKRAEDMSLGIGKACRQIQTRGQPAKQSGATWRDVAELAYLIHDVARRARFLSAAEATEIAEYVERWLDLLRTEITELLAG